MRPSASGASWGKPCKNGAILVVDGAATSSASGAASTTLLTRAANLFLAIQ
jgi:hypothetical protein